MNKEISSAVEAYLKEKIGFELYALDFTQEHYNELLVLLKKQFGEADVKRSKEQIKEGVKTHFFKTKQHVDIRLSEERIKISKLFGTEDEHSDRIAHALNITICSLLEESEQYKKSDILLEFPSNIREKLMEKLAVSQESDTYKKELIREAFYSIFPIKSNDMVLFLRSSIYIRTFIPKKKSADGSERRLEGADPKKIQECYEQNFTVGAWDDISAMLPDLMHDKLNFAKISNKNFTKNFVPALLSLIDIIVDKNISDEVCTQHSEAISLYILRLYFDQIMTVIATDLVRFVIDRNSNAEKFVKYYEDETVLEKGKKFKKTPIIDEAGQKWNYSSILSVLMQWKQAQKKVDEIEKEIENKKERQEQAKELMENELQKLKELESERDLIHDELREKNAEKARMKQRESSASNSDQKKEISIQIARLNSEVARMLDKHKAAQNRCSQQQIRVDNKETEHNNWNKHIQAEAELLSHTMEKNKDLLETYKKIVKALAKTLAKR